MLPNSTVNVLFRVSVRTNVPEMKVTPSTIASAVSASRSLWASRPLMVTFLMSGAQGPHLLQDRIGGRLFELAYHDPVGQEDDPVRVRGPPRVVSDHDDRLAQLGHRLSEKREQFRGGIGVQIARGLVGEDEVRLVDQRPGARDTLLLTARQLTGTVRQPVADTQLSHQVIEPLPVDLGARQGGRQGDVLSRGQRRRSE